MRGGKPSRRRRKELRRVERLKQAEKNGSRINWEFVNENLKHIKI